MDAVRLDIIHDRSTELCERIQDLVVESDEVIELSYALAKVREVRRVLGDFERQIVRKIVANAEERQYDVEGVGRFEIKGGRKNTQWRKGEVIHEFIRAYSDEYGVPRSRRDVANMFDTFTDCVSIGAAKVAWTELTGVEFDEVSKQEDAAKSVAIFTPETAPRIEGF
jgi:hypothetical protein